MDIDPNDPRIPSRPLWGLLILALPALGLVVVGLSYLGMFALGTRGRPADGPVVPLWYALPPSCGDLDLQEAGPVATVAAAGVVQARLQDMGLEASPLPAAAGSTTFGFLVEMPKDPALAQAIPGTLAKAGLARLAGGETPLADNADIASATVRMDLFMQPYLLLDLDEDASERVKAHVRSDPQGQMTLWVDGVAVASQRNANPVEVGEVELAPIDPSLDEEKRWAAVAEWSILVDHPLPCALTATAPAELPPTVP